MGVDRPDRTFGEWNETTPVFLNRGFHQGTSRSETSSKMRPITFVVKVNLKHWGLRKMWGMIAMM